MSFPDAVRVRFYHPQYVLLASDSPASASILSFHDAQETVWGEYHVWKSPSIKMRFRVYGSPVYWAILDYVCECMEQGACPTVEAVLQALTLTPLYRPHVLLCLGQLISHA